MITKDDFKSAAKLETKELEVKIGGKNVLIREMTNRHYEEVQGFIMAGVKVVKGADGETTSTVNSVAGATTFTLLRSLCDAEGALIFDPKSKEDAALLDGLPGSLTSKICEAALEFSGFSNSVVDEKEKN
jgi:hypothetical protein